jgi:hypothetical protein
MPSEKETCFREAVEELQKTRGKKLDVDYERPWVKDDVTERWEPIRSEAWWKAVHSIKKTLRILAGRREPEPGRASPIQIRKPDMTITQSDGSKLVVDNKYSRPDGTKDKWGTRKGMSGSRQQGDYDEINKQSGKEKAKELKLDRDTCKCGEGEPEPEEVKVYAREGAGAPGQLYFMPLPGALPALPPLTIPGPAPLPIPVFP